MYACTSSIRAPPSGPAVHRSTRDHPSGVQLENSVAPAHNVGVVRGEDDDGTGAAEANQQVHDPLSLEKEREVRKLLRQTEEAK